MLKSKTIMVFAVTGMLMSGSVCAYQGENMSADMTGEMYGGVQFAIIGLSSSDIDAGVTGLVGRVGRYVTDNISVEGRLGIGLSEEDNGAREIDDVTVELDTLIGIYAQWHLLDLSNAFNPYATVGFTKIEATASAAGFGSASDDESGLSLGLGVDVGFGDVGTGMNMELIQYMNSSELDAFAFSLGYTFGF